MRFLLVIVVLVFAASVEAAEPPFTVWNKSGETVECDFLEAGIFALSPGEFFTVAMGGAAMEGTVTYNSEVVLTVYQDQVGTTVEENYYSIWFTNGVWALVAGDVEQPTEEDLTPVQMYWAGFGLGLGWYGVGWVLRIVKGIGKAMPTESFE